jgi:hypothetical protein
MEFSVCRIGRRPERVDFLWLPVEQNVRGSRGRTEAPGCRDVSALETPVGKTAIGRLRPAFASKSATRSNRDQLPRGSDKSVDGFLFSLVTVPSVASTQAPAGVGAELLRLPNEQRHRARPDRTSRCDRGCGRFLRRRFYS